MNFYEKILNKEFKISIIGLGYVGLPIAIAFSKNYSVIGFDINVQRVNLLREGFDFTKEVSNFELQNSKVEFTSNENDLKGAKFHIVAVPTPVNDDKTPDLKYLESASRTLGRNLTKDSIVVFESTVYPGTTEEICIPILEKESGLICGIDFKVGYSPERINPGDKIHRLETIIKVVSGMDEDSLNIIAKVYELVVEAGVYKAESIKVAEAAKVIENSQRDLNIAFMNELSIIFNKMNIDTKAVLSAAQTKWNFLPFFPGLVGGHCIGVDPYYLTYKAKQLGYDSEVILSGRKINDSMGKYVANNIVKLLINSDVNVKNSRVAIFGFTFKENCPDIRNTRVIDIHDELKQFGVIPIVYDPQADYEDTLKEYGISLSTLQDIYNVDAIVIAVAHDEFLKFDNSFFEEKFNSKNSNRILIDVKGIYNKKKYINLNYKYFRL
jgi:UDP-N-acetyl-D-glucosamine/UDP-N-acetyl-D-galactosamine dehydrogenase